VGHRDRTRWIDYDQLVFERQRLPEVDRAHSHRQINVFIGGEALRALEECRLVLLEDQQILFRPDDETRAGACFAPAALEKPVVEPRQLVERLSNRTGVALEVQRVLVARVTGGDTKIESVASQLTMSARTLQRRLTEEGVSYQELLDGARKQAAEQYLSESSLAIGEVAYLVGFSEPAAFHRAFKRWFGLTPERFRNQQRSPR
jgi:AraC-like DNA-binding protein